MMDLDSMRKRARQYKGAVAAVAAAQDEEVLGALICARRDGIADAILTGNPEEIRSLLKKLGEKEDLFPIVPADSPEECARLAVACVREGRAGLLMKGLVNTSVLMKAVLHRDQGLRGGRLLSHIMLYQSPSYPRPLFLTDGGLNPFPSREEKAEILENAATVLQALGYTTIRAACVCGSEVVNPKIPSTTDAEALSQMKERWAPYHMEVFGPAGLDLAISQEACRHKKYSAPGAGQADILLVPTYEVGNGIGKAMTYFGGARSAGIVVGAQAPIVLVSRSDPGETKLDSLALAVLVQAGKIR